MRFLLDTQALIWSQDDTTRLPQAAVTALTNPVNVRLLSIASLWEIGIKVAVGKLQLSKPFRLWIQTAVSDLLLTEMPITLDHVDRQISLPFHHRDPFDRVLVAQALVETLPIISNDPALDAYGITRIWT